MNYNNKTKSQLIALCKKKDSQNRKLENSNKYAWGRFFGMFKIARDNNKQIREFHRENEDDIPLFMENQMKELIKECGKHFECSICLDDIESDDLKILKCGHMFHKECCEKWLETSNKCPNCRKVVKYQRN
jgi:hypothetical protein